MVYRPKDILRDRSGVAIILVVGMLALMTVLAISFSIFMRTERVAAGNFRNDVQARQLLHASLARALNGITDNVTTNPYPPWLILESTGTDLVNTNGILTGALTNWIPAGILAATNPAPRWIDVGGSGYSGRVAYVVLNCSGFVDVNAAGGGARSIGTNASEIQVDQLGVANKPQLVADRPYETLPDLTVYGLNKGTLSAPSRDLVCFSYCPTNGMTNGFVNISGNEGALQLRYNDIVSAFIASGIASNQAAFVYTNLLDYVDSDNIPRELGSACTESVPMINELQITNSITFQPNTNMVVRSRLNVEWFYPFLKANPNTYYISASVTWAAVPPSTFPVPAPTNASVLCTYNNAIGPAYNSQGVITFTMAPTNYQAYIGQTIRLRANVAVQIRQGSAVGTIVDASPYPTNLTLTLTMADSSAVPAPGAANIIHSMAYNLEAVDPRFNWATSGQWANSPGTLGGLNSRTTNSWSSRDNVDVFPEMYVKNGPLASVSELTYLLRGTYPSFGATPGNDIDQWNTIRLFDCASALLPHPLDTVLDHFYIPGQGYGSGLLNPNTTSPEALAAVFYEMPVNQYPEETGMSTLTIDQANTLAALWVDPLQNPWSGMMWHVSDLGHVTNVFSSAVFAGMKPLQKESIIRNSAGLLNPRQQYFIVLLFDEVNRNLFGNRSSVCSLTGVAEVWRDPWADSAGNHKTILRLFKVLNNP